MEMITPYFDFIVYGVTPLVVTAVLTSLYRRYLLKNSLLDKPNARSSHIIPTPRGGGVVFMAVGIVYALIYGVVNEQSLYIHLSGLLATLTFLGFMDDRLNLSAKSRLLIQMVIIGLGLYLLLPTGFTLFDGFLPQWLLYGLLFFGLVWYVNLYNFMDGIDGISGLQTLAILTGLSLFYFYHTPILLIFAAVTLGFLVWNFPPAKIFMGDSGSVPLGFLTGFLLVLFAGQNQQDLIIALILPLYYIMDATITLLKRIVRREKIWEAHRSHFYQMVTNADKKTHRNTVFKITFCNVMLWGCAYGVYFIGAWALVPAVVIVSLLLLHFKLSALS